MERYTGIFTILALERGKSSYYGNPSWRIAVEPREGGFRRIAKTAPNIAFSYFICHSHIGEEFVLRYHFTKKGEMIIERGDKLKREV